MTKKSLYKQEEPVTINTTDLIVGTVIVAFMLGIIGFLGRNYVSIGV